MLVWALFALWCLGLAPTWAAFYASLRPGTSRWRAWALASGLAVIWPLSVLQYRRWQRRRSWVDPIEAYLRDR